MKSFLPTVILTVLIVGLFFPFTSIIAATLTGTSPCGPASNPEKVSSPVRLFVDPIPPSATYLWAGEEIGVGSWSVETPNAISPAPVNAVKMDLALGVHSWNVTILSGEVSDVCYIEVTHVCPTGSICLRNPLQSENFTDIIDNILNFLFNIALVLSPIMVVIAGVLFVTAAGKPEQLSRAKQILIWTAVGFGVILLSRGLITIIREIIGF